MQDDAIIVGDWVVIHDRNCVRRGDEERRLQPLSLDILVYLANNAPRVVTSDELIDRFWQGRVVGDDAVHRRIADLRRVLDDDARNPRYIRTISKRGYQLVADVKRADQTIAPAQPRRRLLRGPASLVIAAALSLVGYWAFQVNDERQSFAAAKARAESMIAEDSYLAAYAAIEPFIDEHGEELESLLERILLPVSVHSDPAGVPVYVRASLPGTEWLSLGLTPIIDRALPRGHYKLRIGDDVYMDATHPGITLNSAGGPLRTIELPDDAAPEDMVYIPGGRYRLGAWGFLEEVDLGGFFIDRFEVSNQDFQAFVDAGGYKSARYWQNAIAVSGGELTWKDVQARFVDQTGQAGPAHWELGRFPTGQAMLPVVGVSWYEAVAYLEFRGKSLPSVHHWLRAALGPMEWRYPFAPVLLPHANIDSGALLPVNRASGVEVNGAYDLVGNAAEWSTLDSRQDKKVVIGAGFRDPAWAYNFPHPQDAMARSDAIGFRGVKPAGSHAVPPLPDFPIFNDFRASVRRVADETFAGLAYAFEYRVGSLDAGKVVELGEQVHENWIRREILIPTGRPDDPMPVLLFIPRRFEPPFQAAIYIPPSDSWSPGFATADVDIEDYQLDFVPLSGRVLVWPVYSGSHERYDNYHADAGPERSALALERNHRIRDEVGRVIDFLKSDEEFDGDRVALLALSYGAALAPFVLANEERISAAIIYSGGIAPPLPVFANPINDPNVFWARVRQPVLLAGGRYDPIRPHEFVMEPLLELLATPDDSKRLVLYESGHWPLPRGQMVRDSVAWLDRYLGSPARQDPEN